MNYLWLFFALMSAITASLVSIFGKMGLKSVDANTATAVRSIVMAIFLFAVLIIQGKVSKIPELVSDRNTLLFITLSGVAGALSWLCYFLALKYGTVSKVAPIDKLSVVIAIILSVIILGEEISKGTILGVFFITAGVIIIALS